MDTYIRQQSKASKAGAKASAAAGHLNKADKIADEEFAVCKALRKHITDGKFESINVAHGLPASTIDGKPVLLLKDRCKQIVDPIITPSYYSSQKAWVKDYLKSSEQRPPVPAS